MSASWTEITGLETAMLLVADHASNAADGVELGVPAALMTEHVAWDIGVAPLAHRLCAMLGCPAILGAISRLVIDLNREEDAAGLIPEQSDGRPVPGNAQISAAERQRRIDRYWRPYHDRIAYHISETSPKLLISLHSFTPRLASDDVERPWQIGILYNQDDRAARLALADLAARHVIVGDNLPYSGKVLNATMNHHGEVNGIPYLGIEVRQDLIGDETGVQIWAERLAPVIRMVAAAVSAS